MSNTQNPFGVGPSDNAGTVPNVPGRYQPDAPSARVIDAPQRGGDQDYFNSLMNNMNGKDLHSLITRFMDSFDAKSFIDNIKYQGFNRDEFISNSLRVITVHQMLRFALMGAIRGANFPKITQSSSAIERDLKDLVDRNVIVRSARRANDITILRCTAAIPQWAAHFMGQTGIVKKLPGSACPACLQFPAAASLPMSASVRALHIQFSIHFSRVIGGVFNENIYLAMFNNQLPLNEIPDNLKLILDVRSESDSMAVDVANIIASELRNTPSSGMTTR